MGILMLSLFLKTYDLIPDFIREKDYSDTIYIASVNEDVANYSIELADIMRTEDLPCIVDYRFKNLKSQLSKASELGILITLILGPQEMEKDEIVLRNMVTNKQKIISNKDLIDEIYKLLDEIDDTASEE